MAGNLRPPIPDLVEGEIVIHDGVGSGSPTALIDGIDGDVFSFFGLDSFVEFTISQDSVIWGLHVEREIETYDKQAPKIYKHVDGEWVFIKDTNNISTTPWQVITQLDRGRYRMENQLNRANSRIRSWREWFVEDLSTFKSLIKSQNKIQSLSENNEWIDTGLTEPLTQEDFEAHGMGSLSVIPKAKWQELNDSFEVIAWIDEKPVDGKHETKWLYTNTDPFSPLDRLNEEDEFEMLTYSDETDEVPSTTVSEEGAIDSGKLFTATLDDFDIVTGVEVK